MQRDKKPYLFLDFDGTCTYEKENGEMDLKDDIEVFLTFCVRYFNVIWTSYATEEQIREICSLAVSLDILDEIEYRKVNGNVKVEFIYSIEEGQNFLYIDDDVTIRERHLLEAGSLLNNLIESNREDKEDLNEITSNIKEWLNLD